MARPSHGASALRLSPADLAPADRSVPAARSARILDRGRRDRCEWRRGRARQSRYRQRWLRVVRARTAGCTSTTTTSTRTRRSCRRRRSRRVAACSASRSNPTRPAAAGQRCASTGAKWATVVLPKLSRTLSSLGMDVGRSVAPVSEAFTRPFAFTGTIDTVTFEVPDHQPPYARRGHRRDPRTARPRVEQPEPNETRASLRSANRCMRRSISSGAVGVVSRPNTQHTLPMPIASSARSCVITRSAPPATQRSCQSGSWS